MRSSLRRCSFISRRFGWSYFEIQNDVNANGQTRVCSNVLTAINPLNARVPRSSREPPVSIVAGFQIRVVGKPSRPIKLRERRRETSDFLARSPVFRVHYNIIIPERGLDAV